MSTTPSMLMFMAAASVLIVMPDPNLIFILTRGIGEGKRTAVASSLGVDSRTIYHVVAASVGLPAIPTPSAKAFNTIMFLGAGYVIFLGDRPLFGQDYVVDMDAPKRLLKIAAFAIEVQCCRGDTVAHSFPV